MAYLWPIALVVCSNILYHLCARSMPKESNTLAALTVAYLVAAVCSAALFYLTNPHGSLLQQYARLNAVPVLLGLAAIGLELGYIYAYKAGWPVSTASLVQSAFVSAALLLLGALLYREAITPNKLLGVAVCLAGLYLLGKG